MKHRAMLCVLVTLLASPADAFVAEIWTRTSLQFTNFGRAEASATATGLATLSTSSTTSSHLLTATLSGLSLDAALPVTDPNAAPITSLVFSLRQRPDLQGGGVIGNISGAIASPAVGLTPNTIPVTGGVTFCLLVQHPNCLAQLNLPLGATTARFCMRPLALCALSHRADHSEYLLPVFRSARRNEVPTSARR